MLIHLLLHTNSNKQKQMDKLNDDIIRLILDQLKHYDWMSFRLTCRQINNTVTNFDKYKRMEHLMHYFRKNAGRLRSYAFVTFECSICGSSTERLDQCIVCLKKASEKDICIFCRDAIGYPQIMLASNYRLGTGLSLHINTYKDKLRCKQCANSENFEKAVKETIKDMMNLAKEKIRLAEYYDTLKN